MGKLGPASMTYVDNVKFKDVSDIFPCEFKTLAVANPFSLHTVG